MQSLKLEVPLIVNDLELGASPLDPLASVEWQAALDIQRCHRREKQAALLHSYQLVPGMALVLDPPVNGRA
jgi:hypothetical protein